MSLCKEIRRMDTMLNPAKMEPHDYANQLAQFAFIMQKVGKYGNGQKFAQERQLLDMGREAYRAYEAQSHDKREEFLSALRSINPKYHAQLIGYVIGMHCPGE